RLSRTSIGAIVEPCSHDAHGNITRMPHLPLMEWDFMDRLRSSAAQVVNQGASEATWYACDSDGRRVRKLTLATNGTGKNERIYPGGYELYRESEGLGNPLLERESLPVMDTTRRLALIETQTLDQGAAVPAPVALPRYQFGNHIGSTSLELD